MKEFVGDVELSVEQATSIARAMILVATSDNGVHVQEQEMIDAFYLAACEESGQSPLDLHANAWDARRASDLLSTPVLRDVLLRSCFLLAYADGTCSAGERAIIETISRDIGLTPIEASAVERDVKREMLYEFRDLKVFGDARYDIGRHLGLEQTEVDKLLTDISDQ